MSKERKLTVVFYEPSVSLTLAQHYNSSQSTAAELSYGASEPTLPLKTAESA